MPVVLVEISPAGAPAALARALADACSSAVREGECDLSPTSPPDAVAMVRWDDAEELRVTVQVDQRGDTPAWQTRERDFHASDARVERWRSVGLTVATLAGGASKVAGAKSAPSPQPPPAPRQVPSPASPRSNAAGPSSPHPHRSAAASPSHAVTAGAGWVDATARAGPGLHPGVARLGVHAALDWRPGASPFFVGAALGLATGPRDERGLLATWETAAGRIGAELASGPLSIEPRLGAGWAHLNVQVTDPGSERRDSGGQSVATLNAGIGIVYRWGPIGLVLDASGWQGSSSTRIVLKNQPVTTDDAIGWSVGVGCRFFLW